MGKNLLLIIFYFLLPGGTILSQCINSDSLWKRLIYLRDSSTNSTKLDLQEMLLYLTGLDKCTSKNDTSYSLLLQRIGAAYNETGNYLQAEKYVKKAIQTIAEVPDQIPVKESQLIRSYYLLSLIYRALNRTNDKIRAADSCIAISIRSNSSDTRVLISILDKVEYLFYIGDYHQTINYANEGEIQTSKLLKSRDSLTYLFNFLIWKVNSLIFLEKYDEAEKLLNENMGIYTAGSLNDFQGIILDRMAFVKTKKGNYKEAVAFYRKSLKFDKRTNNYLASLWSFENMGFALYDKGLHDDIRALICYREALYFASKIFKIENIKDSIQAIIESLYIYNKIGNIFNKRSQFDSAQYFYQKGFNQIHVSENDKNFVERINKEFLQNKSIPDVINALIDQADSYLNQFKKTKNIDLLLKASSLYANADKLQDVIKNEQTELQSQLFWRNNLRRLYEHAIENSRLIGNMDKVFYYFEKSRSVLLNDQLNKQLLLNRDDILKLGLVRIKIVELNRILTSLNPSSDEYKETQNELFTYNGDLNLIEQQIQKNNPEYVTALEDTVTIHLNDVQKTILNDHDALLELFDGDSIVYSLIITPKQAYLNKIDKSDFENTSNSFISYIANASILNSHYDQYTESAKHLYQLIFNQFPIPKGRIIISPDGRYFPFEALISNTNVSKSAYFLNDHIVSYTYSVRFILNDFTKNKIYSTGNFLGIAPIQYPSTFNLPPLSNSDVSLEKISSYFENAKTLVTAAASKNNFIQQFYGYKIIQLYTHASDSSSNGEPIIYFADSILSLSELISENKTATQLIVLSACETGNGKLYKGEGVFSFNRGFAALGIPSSVINLWSVENESTYKITELFYKYTAKGLPLDIALQKAKLDFIAGSSKEKKLPFYWAAAILAGKTDPVILTAGFNWKWVAMAGGVLLVFLAFILIKRKK
jgi:CHAT domain-containing protein